MHPLLNGLCRLKMEKEEEEKKALVPDTIYFFMRTSPAFRYLIF